MEIGIERVVVDEDGLAAAPARAKSFYKITHISRIFVRRDGWTLAASPRHEDAARRLWQGEWVREIKLDPPMEL